MKILFCVAECKHLGVSGMMSYLRQNGHEAELWLDPLVFNTEFFSIPSVSRFFDKSQFLRHKINTFKPDVIGFSANSAQYGWALKWAKWIKEEIGNYPIMFGGVHPTLVPETVISEEVVDMICVGEGEEAILDFANAPWRTDTRGIWFKEGGKITRNPMHDLVEDVDKYPLPADDDFYAQLFPGAKILTDVMAGRGCPYKCSFCSLTEKQALYAKPQDGSRKKWLRMRSVDNVVKEMIWRKEKHGTKLFDFKNEVFAVNRVWLHDFCKEYKKHVDLPFYCYYSPNMAREETIALIRDAGCRAIHFGLQSGSETIRRNVLNRFESNSKAVKAAELCHKAGIKFSTHCILDIPFETDETTKESISVYNQMRPSDVSVYTLMYFPKSHVARQAVKAGFFDEDYLKKIDEGKANMVPRLLSDTMRWSHYYKKYAVFFSAIPLLPKWLVRKVATDDKWFKWAGRLPLRMLLPVKFVALIYGGWGKLMPFILYNEVYNVYNHFKQWFLLKFVWDKGRPTDPPSKPLRSSEAA